MNTNITTRHKGLSHLYMPNTKNNRTQIIQTQLLQHHKLGQINLIKQSSKVIRKRRLNHIGCSRVSQVEFWKLLGVIQLLSNVRATDSKWFTISISHTRQTDPYDSGFVLEISACRVSSRRWRVVYHYEAVILACNITSVIHHHQIQTQVLWLIIIIIITKRL